MALNALNVSSAELKHLTTQLQAVQLPIQHLDQISRAFINIPSLDSVNQLLQQMQTLNAPVAKIRWELSQWNVQLPIQQLSQISDSFKQASLISQQISTNLAPISKDLSLMTQAMYAAAAPISQLNTISGSLAKVQQQMAQLKPFAVGYDKICGSKRSGVYHRSICPYTQRIEPENLVMFSSAKEAKEKGYAPCKLCKPP